jgi:hypothetical protein
MTHPILRWCFLVGIDVFTAIAFWRGALLGETGWTNLFTFYVWFLIIAGILFGCFDKKTLKGNFSRARYWYDIVTDVALLIAIAWIGWLWRAGFFCFALLLVHGRRYKALHPKGEA